MKVEQGLQVAGVQLVVQVAVDIVTEAGVGTVQALAAADTAVGIEVDTEVLGMEVVDTEGAGTEVDTVVVGTVVVGTVVVDTAAVDTEVADMAADIEAADIEVADIVFADIEVVDMVEEVPVPLLLAAPESLQDLYIGFHNSDHTHELLALPPLPFPSLSGSVHSSFYY